jgi:hypothetical protein
MKTLSIVAASKLTGNGEGRQASSPHGCLEKIKIETRRSGKN